MVIAAVISSCIGPIDTHGTWNRYHNLVMSLLVSPVALISVLVSWARLCFLLKKYPLESYFYCISDYQDHYIMKHAFAALLVTKYIEWIDTVWLILRRRNIQILHLFHHSTIVIIFQTGSMGGAWGFVGILNSIIHIFMYGYYAKVQFLIPYAQYITSLQITHLS